MSDCDARRRRPCMYMLPTKMGTEPVALSNLTQSSYLTYCGPIEE